MGCGCGRNSVMENPVKTEVKQEVTFDSLIGKLHEIINKVVFKGKADPNQLNYIEMQNDKDHFLVTFLNLNDAKLLTNVYNKLQNIKELQDQFKKLHPQLNIVFDYEPSSKKLFLILSFQFYYGDKPHSTVNAININNKIKEIEINDSLAGDESFRSALQNSKSIKKLVFKVFHESKIQSVLDSIKTNKSIETLTLKDLKLSGEFLKEIFNSFFMENTTLTSLNLMKNKLDINGDGIGALKDTIVNSKIPLKKLNLSSNVLKSDKIGSHLSEIFKSKQLIKFKINRCQYSNLDLWNQIYSVSPSHIQILDLSFNHIDLDLVSDFVAKNNNLTKLILQKIRIPKKCDFTKFGNVFISSSSLKTLGFFFDVINEENKLIIDMSRLIEFYNGFNTPSRCEKSYKTFKMELTPDVINAFANNIKANDCITEANFSSCVFKENSFEIFLNSLTNLNNFKSLIIESVEIGPNDVKQIPAFLGMAKSLVKFDLSNTKLSTEEINLIGDAILANSSIKSVGLSNTLGSETDPNEFLKKLGGSTIEEIDFSFCDGKNGFSEAFGVLLNSCKTLKTVKVGRKQEDFDSKVNNNMFLITNKLNIENFLISNIKFDGNAMKDFILNSDNLKTLSLNNSVNNTNFVKFLVEKNRTIEMLNFTVPLINGDDLQAISKVLSIVKSFNVKPSHIEPSQVDIIFDGLKGNQIIEKFNIDFTNFENTDFCDALRKYYKNVLTCPNLTDLMIYNIPENEDDIKVKNEAKEVSKTIFQDFHKSLCS